MKGLSSMSEAERAEATREMRAELARNRTTIGFYIQKSWGQAPRNACFSGVWWLRREKITVRTK